MSYFYAQWHINHLNNDQVYLIQSLIHLMLVWLTIEGQLKVTEGANLLTVL